MHKTFRLVLIELLVANSYKVAPPIKNRGILHKVLYGFLII